MAFNLNSGNSTPFKMMGSSPVKQGIDPLDLGLLDEAKKVKISTMPKNFNMTGKDTWVKQSKELLKKGKKVAKKVIKGIGGKALGVAGMMMATSSKADQPTKKQGGGQMDPNWLKE
tara:strand:- start:2283 stop:2630 length:348 start_codon:yes stop_codon:yes gene_type:complete